MFIILAIALVLCYVMSYMANIIRNRRRLTSLHAFFRSQILDPEQSFTIRQLSDANDHAWLLYRVDQRNEILKQLETALHEIPLHLTGVQAILYVGRCVRIVNRIAHLCVYNRDDKEEVVRKFFLCAIHKHILQVELIDGFLTIKKSADARLVSSLQMALDDFEVVPTVSKLKLQLWSPATHYSYPASIKRAIKTVLLLSLRDPVSLAPRHPNANFWLLPRELLFYVIELAVQNWYD